MKKVGNTPRAPARQKPAQKNSPGLFWRGVIDRYARYLPITAGTPIISLSEGNTPLIRVDNFVRAIGGDFELWLKFEGLNPTCSFKDRGMTMAVSKAAERGAQIIICASTGNTSASAAAYAARAGMKCVVLLPHGKIALGKLAQALMYGATTIAIEGNFDEALRIVREVGETGTVEVVNSINPVRIEGQKTAAFEICDQLGRAPDFHFLPVGNAGNITAYWKGYKEYYAVKKSDRLPRMFGFQAAGAAPMAIARAPIAAQRPSFAATVSLKSNGIVSSRRRHGLLASPDYPARGKRMNFTEVRAKTLVMAAKAATHASLNVLVFNSVFLH